MAGGERRKQPRFVVDAVNLNIGGASYPVIDISISGARISCTPRDYSKGGNGPVALEFNREGRRETFTINPRPIRMADLYVVLGFDPPRADWENYIRQFDTFHVHELDDQLFD
jgi:hypothetical protein